MCESVEFSIFAVMRTDLLNKYIWIVDTITSRGRVTRRQLNDLWERSAYFDGHPIPHRTFFNYRRDIEELFGIDILCDNLDRYYIASPESPADEKFRSWMLDNFAMRSAISTASDISGRIDVENVPSARQFLSTIIQAMRSGNRIMFSYAGFNRIMPDEDILFEPYFLKLFKQRWYMIGRRSAKDDIRTYALDRVVTLTIRDDTFTLPDGLEPADLFGDIFGITSSQGEVEHVEISTNQVTAKYLRALPLHHSQREDQYSDRSIFHYRIKLTGDFLRELMSFGSDIEVVAPPQLRLMMRENLKQTLEKYEK